jgi:hypothetical protein
LYPIGQVGLTAVTFLAVLPLTQVMVVFTRALAAGWSVTAGVGVAVTTGVAEAVGASCVSFTFKVGDENVNPFADK